jgi:hypothetical protein
MGLAMSNRLMNLVWPLDLPQTEKSVLIALADRADDATAQTWIAIRSLQVPRKLDLITMTGLSERTIQNALKALNGVHLTRKDVPGRGVIYTIHPRMTCTPVQDAPPQEMHPATDTPTPARDAPKPSVTLNSPSKASPSSERERVPAGMRILIGSIVLDVLIAACRPPARKPASAKRRWPRDMPPPPGVSDEQWAGLVDHRLAKRKPLTPRAYELLCGRLAKVRLPEWPPGRIVDTIVERSWTNFEEPWLIRITDQINGTGNFNDRTGRRGGYRDPLLRHYAGGGDPGLG